MIILTHIGFSYIEENMEYQLLVKEVSFFTIGKTLTTMHTHKIKQLAVGKGCANALHFYLTNFLQKIIKSSTS